MDQLVCLIQKRGSICRQILLRIFLAFTIIRKCASNPEICTINSRRNVAYFNSTVQEANWTTAWQECIKLQARLPIICNKEEQDAFINQLKGIGVSSTIWTAGKRINLPDWTWINGQRFMDRLDEIMTTPPTEYYTHAALNEKLRYKSANPMHKNYYLCQYSGSSCTGGNSAINIDLSANKGCVRPSDAAGKPGDANGRLKGANSRHRKAVNRPSDEDGTWYEARNKCLMTGGDLAVLDDADLVIFNRSNRLVATHSYWIGLRKSTCHWIYQQTANSSKEIKYTNLSENGYHPGLDCISINPLNGNWTTDRCSDKKRVIICERDVMTLSSSSSNTVAGSTTSTTASATSTMSSPAMPNAVPSTAPNRMSSMPDGATINGINSTSNFGAQSQVQIYAAVGATVVVIVICIIAIIFVIRYKRKSHKDKDCLNDNKQSDRLNSNELRNNPSSKSPAKAPANAAVTKTEDVGGVYAEIPLARLSQAEEGSQTQQPGVVYASLEFQKEPTYMEPNTKRASADRTKVGPMGDIYATPDAKGGVVTSPGSELLSHPFKVAPQGDVYALPVKDSKSPTAKTPGGAIYANT